MIARLLFYLLGSYAFIVAAMYMLQRHLQYFPDTASPGVPADSGLQDTEALTVQTADGLENVAWFMPPKEKDGHIIVMFHGNAGHIGHRNLKARHFWAQGYGVFMCEYRGFGGNKGKPSEEGFYADARACLARLEADGYSASQFVLYGESIGTGVAVQMALEIQPKWLVLEAPFASAADVAKLKYFWLPVDVLLKDRYDSIKKIGDVRSSLLIMHGDEDMVIPQSQGKKLFEAANHPKEFASILGAGHADLYDFYAGYVVTDWLEKKE